MGTNFADFLVEAKRVLRPSGRAYVAEVRSRFAGEGAEAAGDGGGGAGWARDGGDGDVDDAGLKQFAAYMRALGFRQVSCVRARAAPPPAGWLTGLTGLTGAPRRACAGREEQDVRLVRVREHGARAGREGGARACGGIEGVRVQEAVDLHVFLAHRGMQCASSCPLRRIRRGPYHMLGASTCNAYFGSSRISEGARRLR